MSRFGRTVDFLDHLLNPILVKELRQAVRSKLVLGVLILFLVIQLGIVGFAALESADNNVTQREGQHTFLRLLAIVYGACLLCLPVYVGARVGLEREGQNVDLVYVTTLSPRAIVWGKLFSALVLAVLVFAACAPFMTFTYLLRGVDLPTIFLLLGLAILMTAVATQAGIFVGLLPVSRFFKIVIGLAAVIGLCFLLVGTMEASEEILGHGLWRRGRHWEALMVVALFITHLVALMGILFCLSMAIVAPPSSNRAVAPRLWVTGSWVVSALVFWLVWRSIGRHDEEVIIAFAGIWSFVFAFAYLIAISERERLGARVRARVPRLGIFRPIKFLFYSGEAGGMAWTSLMLLLTYGFAALLIPKEFGDLSDGMLAAGSLHSDARAIAACMTVPLYAFAYCTTGLMIWRAFLRNWISKYLVGAVAVVVCAAWAILPPVIAMIVNPRLLDRLRDFFLAGNPVQALGGEKVATHLCFSFAWAVIMLLVYLPRLGRGFRDFRPPEVGVEPEAAAVVEAEPARVGEESG